MTIKQKLVQQIQSCTGFFYVYYTKRLCNILWVRSDMSYGRLSFNQDQQHNYEHLNIDNCIGRTTYVIIYSPFIKRQPYPISCEEESGRDTCL